MFCAMTTFNSILQAFSVCFHRTMVETMLLNHCFLLSLSLPLSLPSFLPSLPLALPPPPSILPVPSRFSPSFSPSFPPSYFPKWFPSSGCSLPSLPQGVDVTLEGLLLYHFPAAYEEKRAQVEAELQTRSGWDSVEVGRGRE